MNLKDVLSKELYGQVTEALKGKGKDGKDVELAVANDGSYLPKAKFGGINAVEKPCPRQWVARLFFAD